MKTPISEIHGCFDAALLVFLPTLGVTAADVAWPNVAFNPAVDRLYLQSFLLPARTTTRSLGTDGFEQLKGIYQVTINGVADTGLADMERIADRLVDRFRGGTVLDCCGNRVVVDT